MYRLLLCLAPLLLGLACAAPRPAQPFPEDALAPAELEAHLRFLASDELMGRRAGTPGNDVAARYLAEQFREVGLQRLTGAEDYYQPIPFEQTPSWSNNVVGLIEGNDPTLRDEYVVLTAHYDHVGAGMRNGRGATPADSIFNGARDNGMGTVALLGAAKALSVQPPKRSVLVLAVTAEENGLLGSRYFVEHPLVPLKQIVFVLNIDGGGYSDTTIATLIGLGRTTADPLLQAGAAAYGLDLIADPAPEQNLFDRSDNVNFARQGIPAPTFSPGFRSFSDDGVARYYHRPQDEVDEAFDVAYFTRFVQAYTHAARLIADHAERPAWQPGDKYEEAARQLYGSN